MTPEIIGLVGLAVLALLLLLRMPVGLSLILVSFTGIYILLGPRPAWGILTSVPYQFAAKWTLSSVPMFLLMGYVCYHGGMTRALFAAARAWLGALPGGLAIASVFGAGGFAAVTGSSVACAAAMGRIAVPEMTRAGYDPGLATGSIAAAGTLGALIPPSILLILFGIFAQVPIGQLFLGGIGAGVLTAVIYAAMIYIRVWINPALAPVRQDPAGWGERFAHLRGIWPVILLFVVVIGGMFAGLFTATEAGAVGALAACVIAWAGGGLTLATLRQSVNETIVTTAALFLIAIGANLLTRFLALSGSGELITQTILTFGASELALVLGIALVYIILGMFLDPIGAMLLTLPVLLPVVDEAGISLIWFGVFVAKFLEIGMITPPVGLNVFVIKGVVDRSISLGVIFRGVIWFLVADAVVVTIMVAFPQVILWLPGLS
ncbi:TRAP transporter large permease [Roseobacter sp. GAI101]|uniref:TRAP transporter large permease n=1 Tax=Roseobacter sp. (strain GAI101) TaxID=391589 RepID=UPI0001871890|nr:TRAP transporter large permease [Roseobacter sp. GAI101]EEB84664.1 trap-t family transporter, dctm (12 tms) subunit [Roseobacter sp. GAI101]